MLAEAMERITDGVFAVDVSGYYTFVNKMAAEKLKIDPIDYASRLAWNDFPEDFEKQLYKACQKAIEQQTYHCQEIYSAQDDRWTEYRLFPSPEGLTILFHDITSRKTAEEEWKKAESQYRALIEQASDPIMITDMQGNFLDANSLLCTMFGYTREELLKLNIRALLDPEELKIAPIQFAVLAAGIPVLRDRRMVHKNGTIIEVEANVKRTPDGRLLAIARDITERKTAARQILKEKEILDSIINSLPGVFLIREVYGLNMRWNQRLETISGYSAQEIPHLDAYHFFEEKNKDHMRQRVDNLLKDGRSSSEVIIVAKDGRRIPFFLTAMVMILEEKRCVVVIGLDISERIAAEEELQRANERLRDLSAHLQQVREEERKRIALEIHDELGQQLTALKMDLAWSIKKSPKEGAVFEKMSGMSTLIDQTIATIRRISSELRPSILDDLGLAEALDWQSSEFEKRYHISTRFECLVNELNIHSNVVTGLFRIYQESLTNVARHAAAKIVLGTLKLEDDILILQVKDDGRGFDTQNETNKGTFGLIGMRERAFMMGGQCSIVSGLNKGTVITISVPLQNNQ
jgi:PAS domain S-box-containing protein